MTTALSVNSAGDCVAGTYGWKRGRGRGFAATVGVAMGRILALAPQPMDPVGRAAREPFRPGGFVTICFSLVKGPNKAAGEVAEGQAEPRSGLRAHHQPALGVPALPQPARRRRRPDHLVAGAGRAVPSERRPDSQGPRVLRRVRRPRRRLLRPRSEAPPAPDSRPRSQAARRDHRRRQPRASRSPTIPGSARKGSKSARCSTT